MTESVKVESVSIPQTERVVVSDIPPDTVAIVQTENIVTRVRENEVVVTGGLLPRTYQAITSIGGASDVDLSELEDGSMLVYEQNIERWKAVKKLEKQIMEGGFY